MGSDFGRTTQSCGMATQQPKSAVKSSALDRREVVANEYDDGGGVGKEGPLLYKI